MEEEKKICPNCGKELTKSARKCKYCETRIEPIKITKEERLATFLGYTFVFTIIAIVIAISIAIYKAVVNIQHSANGFNLSVINHLLTDNLLPWLINTGIGPVIGTIVFGGIMIAIFVGSIKQALPGTKEILDELAESLANINSISNKNVNNTSSNKCNNEIEDFRKGKYGKYGSAASNPNVYAVVRYKSKKPNETSQLFYDFKVWAYHIKDAPQSILVKGKNPHNTYFVDYDSYQIISSNEYTSSNLPTSYDYYNK